MYANENHSHGKRTDLPFLPFLVFYAKYRKVIRTFGADDFADIVRTRVRTLGSSLALTRRL